MSPRKLDRVTHVPELDRAKLRSQRVQQLLGLLAFTAVFAVASTAQAEINSSGILNNSIAAIKQSAQQWQEIGLRTGRNIFWSLAVISLVWTMGELLLKGAGLAEGVAEFFKFAVFTSFWAFMLENGPQHAEMIISGLQQLGSDATGTQAQLPSGVLDLAFVILDRITEHTFVMQPLDSLLAVLLGLGLVVILALIAANMLVALVSCWVVAYAGLVILGFGGCRWTNDMAVNYYRMVLSLGLQVFTMILVVGIGNDILRSYYDKLGGDISFHEQTVLVVVAILLLALVNKIPALVGTLTNGSSPHYALGGGMGAGAAIAALRSKPVAGATKAASATAKASLGAAAAGGAMGLAALGSKVESSLGIGGFGAAGISGGGITAVPGRDGGGGDGDGGGGGGGAGGGAVFAMPQPAAPASVQRTAGPQSAQGLGLATGDKSGGGSDGSSGSNKGAESNSPNSEQEGKGSQDSPGGGQSAGAAGGTDGNGSTEHNATASLGGSMGSGGSEFAQSSTAGAGASASGLPSAAGTATDSASTASPVGGLGPAGNMAAAGGQPSHASTSSDGSPSAGGTSSGSAHSTAEQGGTSRSGQGNPSSPSDSGAAVQQGAQASAMGGGGQSSMAAQSPSSPRAAAGSMGSTGGSAVPSSQVATAAAGSKAQQTAPSSSTVDAARKVGGVEAQVAAFVKGS